MSDAHDALAEALDATTYPEARDGYGFDGDIQEFAAAIHAALDAAGWTLEGPFLEIEEPEVPSGGPD